MKSWITLEYCILFYCMWMIYDFEKGNLITTEDWWQEVIIEIDKPPQQLSLF